MGSNTVLELTVSVLAQSPSERPETDLQQIVPWLRLRSDVFKRLKTEQLLTVLRGCGLMLPRKDEIIVCQGDVGDCCFVNMSGKVSIYNKTDAALYLASDSDHPLAVGEVCAKRERMGTYVVSLGAGAPFGEMALLSSDSTRKAFVVADEDMHVMVINRELFNVTIRQTIEEEYRDKRAFINSSAFFAKWTPDYREQLAMALEREVYFYDQFVVRQGDQADSLFFIVSGEAQIFINPVAHELYFRRQLLEGRDTADVIRNKVRQLKVLIAQKFHKREVLSTLDEEDDILSFEAFRPSPVTTEHSLLRIPRQGSAGAMEKKRMIMLCVQRPVGVVGDLEYFLQLDKYAHSVMCTQRTVVLRLETRQYERLSKKNQSTTHLLMDVLKRKLRHRIDGSQTVSREVPLMKYALIKSYTLCQNYEYEQVKAHSLAMPLAAEQKARFATRDRSKSAIGPGPLDETKVVRYIKRDYERKAMISPADRRDITIPIEYLRVRFGNEMSSLIGLNRPVSAGVSEPLTLPAARITQRSLTARPGLDVSASPNRQETQPIGRRRAKSAVEQVRLALQSNRDEPPNEVNFYLNPMDKSALKRNHCLMLFRNKGIYTLG